MLFGRRRDPAANADTDRFTADALALIDILYGTALRLTRNQAAAEDLVQDTYLKAFRAKRRFQPGTNFKAWIFTILQNTWRNRRRDAARSRIDYDSEAVRRLAETDAALSSSVVESAETRLLQETLDADLSQALEALPEAFREAVWLRDVEELSYQEIASALHVPIGTVMSRISRGRKQLHDRLLIGQSGRAAHPVGRSGV